MPGFFSLRVGLRIRVVHAVAVGIPFEDPSRVLYRVVAIARSVAAGLSIVVLLRFLLVIDGLLLLALDVLGLQDLLLLGNSRDLCRVGLIDVYDGLLCGRSAGPVRVDSVALSIDRFVDVLRPHRTTGMYEQDECYEKGTALRKI